VTKAELIQENENLREMLTSIQDEIDQVLAEEEWLEDTDVEE